MRSRYRWWFAFWVVGALGAAIALIQGRDAGWSLTMLLIALLGMQVNDPRPRS